MSGQSRGMADAVNIKGRFVRSVTVGKDSAAESLDGYLPTGRSLDVLRRIAHGMSRRDAARAFTVTGPYGSGKSSLAVLLDSALGPVDSPAYLKAREILRDHAPDVLTDLDEGRAAIEAGPSGFVRAVITAPQREPILTTTLRALERGTSRAGLEELSDRYSKMLKRAESTKYSSPTFEELTTALKATCAAMPVLLLIDEFGKNLEAYADAGGDGDLYLLQELAELTQGSDRLPLVIATIQHLAFEAYAADASAAQRREWAKVQGRLEDIPFLDSPAATRRLIAEALVHDEDPTRTRLRHEAAHTAASNASVYGIAEVADPGLVAACWPLHPSVLLVLPDLCARYGQNERTLFSFLASDAPSSAKSVIADAPPDEQMPWVRLDSVYDYFVESASTFVGASRDASRWIEIETTIRDAHGLTEAQRRVLKTIGVFNLVSTVGTVRASDDLLEFALAGSHDELRRPGDLAARIAELLDLGIVVHRQFAGEYRLWKGSDYDLDGSLSAARRRAKEMSPAALLESVAPQGPQVAARHAIEQGTIRAFDRVWADGRTRSHRLPTPASASDGLLLYVVDPEGDCGALPDNPTGIPVVTVTPEGCATVLDAAVEVAALSDVGADTGLRGDDHAVRRELAERLGHAQQVLSAAITSAYGPDASWEWRNPTEDWTAPTRKVVGTSYLSAVLDAAYPYPWGADYEAINRAELSSAGSRARNIVITALTNPTERGRVGLGLTGNGAEVAIYRAVLRSTGLHGPDGIQTPRPAYRPVWNRLMDDLDGAKADRVDVTYLIDRLMVPPHGLRAGVAGIVVVAGLLHRAADIAVYEHGTFKPALDAALIERLVRNPQNFAVKHLGVADGRSTRGRVLSGLADALGCQEAVLPVTKRLVRIVAGRGRYVRTTRTFHTAWLPDADDPIDIAAAVRDAIAEANQPDDLLFTALPSATGHAPAASDSTAEPRMRRADVDDFIQQIQAAVTVVEGAQERLIDHVAERVFAATHTSSPAQLAAAAETVAEVETASPEVRTFAGQAMLAGYADTTSAWVTSLVTACTGTPPENWRDADIGPAVARLERIAGDFRRLHFLAERRSSLDVGEPFTAWTISATRQDGTAHDTVVAVPNSKVDAGAAALDRALADLRAQGMDEEAAVSLLTGTIARRLAGGPSATSDTESATAIRKVRCETNVKPRGRDSA